MLSKSEFVKYVLGLRTHAPPEHATAPSALPGDFDDFDDFDTPEASVLATPDPTDFAQGLQPPKAFGHALHLQHRRTHAPPSDFRSGVGHRPCGRHSITMIMASAINN